MRPPEIFFERMKEIFPGDINELRACYEAPPTRGIRINTLKFPVERVAELRLELEPTVFSRLGFLVKNDNFKAGDSVWHHAGAFYAQEPSAMSAVSALDPQPGERILDMCAAPGGKSTQIAAALDGRGILWSNEYVRSRAQSLISNLERVGCRNAVVTSLHPDALAEGMADGFDRVLVDAPCSGEGMFRREEAAVRDWSPENVAACAVRQLAILSSAASCVCPGGVLVYSTCTFSLEEDERVVAAFLEQNPEFALEPIAGSFGHPGIDIGARCDTTLARRVFPTDGGEGHFVARMRREGDWIGAHPLMTSIPPQSAEVRELLGMCFAAPLMGESLRIGDLIYLLPPGYTNPAGLPVLRAGVLLGAAARGRLEPSHALFMCARDSSECACAVELAPDSRQLDAFLRGEQLEMAADMRGYTAVACGGVVTGFGKASGGALKNHYPKGLRIMGKSKKYY